jgi:hypothetical protein
VLSSFELSFDRPLLGFLADMKADLICSPGLSKLSLIIPTDRCDHGAADLPATPSADWALLPAAHPRIHLMAAREQRRVSLHRQVKWVRAHIRLFGPLEQMIVAVVIITLGAFFGQCEGAD